MTYFKSLRFLLPIVGLFFFLPSCSKSMSPSEIAAKQSILAVKSFYNTPRSSFYPAQPSEYLKSRSVNYKRDRKGYPTYPDTIRHRYVRSTAYSDKENEPGAPSNFNAAGTRLKYTSSIRSAAADWSVYPMGTKLKIKGLPYTYVVDDYGSALVGTNTLDIYHLNLKTMRKWGTRPIEIHVIEWGSWERSAQILQGRIRHSHCRKMYYSLLKKLREGVVAKTAQP